MNTKMSPIIACLLVGFLIFNSIYGQSLTNNLKISLQKECRKFEPEIYTDPRDGSQYEFITVANQNWMTVNLRFETAPRCNGLKTFSKGNDGNYYSIEGAYEAIPPGWRLPSKEDYKVLLKNLNIDYDSTEQKKRYRSLFQDSGDPLKLYSKKPFYHKDINFWYFLDFRTQYFWTSSSWYCPFQATYNNRSGVIWYRFAFNCIDEILYFDLWGSEDDFYKVRCVRDL